MAAETLNRQTVHLIAQSPTVHRIRTRAWHTYLQTPSVSGTETQTAQPGCRQKILTVEMAPEQEMLHGAEEMRRMGSPGGLTAWIAYNANVEVTSPQRDHISGGGQCQTTGVKARQFPALGQPFYMVEPGGAHTHGFPHARRIQFSPDQGPNFGRQVTPGPARLF